MSKDILYMASGSAGRKKMLEEAGIPFVVIQHASDEQIDALPHDFQAYVLEIAKDKMRTAQLPAPHLVAQDRLFVLTADTLVRTQIDGHILGKPRDMDDAYRMLTLVSQGPIDVVTACVVNVYHRVAGAWELEAQDDCVVSAVCEFIVKPEDQDAYLARTPQVLNIAAASTIEGSGQKFLKSVTGSYTTILGLPLFEVCDLLKQHGFRF